MSDKICCLCSGPLDVKRTSDGEIYWDKGENAHPVKDGRCCLACNATIVIPTRLWMAFGGRSEQTAESD